MTVRCDRAPRWALHLALPFVLLGSACCASLFAQDGPPVDGAALFAAQCARCHGVTGDGNGPENVGLERPARSFAAGGFSFGDTHEAIRRTLDMGIPGSPMPAFGETLTLEQRDALAAHVRTLIPERRRVSTDETELVVGALSALARGHLAPLSDGARAHSRGLVIGTPQGLSFVFRADDLRLMGVTQGRFVRRTDWTGRGGTPLELLGEPLWLHESGDPARRWFAEVEGERIPLRLVLQSTELHASGAVLSARLLDSDRRERGTLELELGRLRDPFTFGFRQSWTVRPAAGNVLALEWRAPQRSAEARVNTVSIGLRGGPCHGSELQLASRTVHLLDDSGAMQAWRWTPSNHVQLDIAREAEGRLSFRFGVPPGEPSCDSVGLQSLHEEVLISDSLFATDDNDFARFLGDPTWGASTEPAAATNGSAR